MNDRPQDLSRRRLLGTAGAAGAAGLLVGGASGAVTAHATRDEATALTSVGATAVPFHGTHQAGITTPLQARGHLVAFDLAAGAGRKGAAALLRRWSAAAEAMTEGRAPAGDNQVALDAGPSSLTVTFGFGRTFFTRTELTGRLPEALAPLPDFASDALDRRRSDGDLWIQIGADDALVAFHALRVLQKEAAGTASLRWQMNGFNRTPGTTAEPRTARNLMGQVDGSNNPRPSDPDFDARVFVPAAGSPQWMAGGSYAVVRRIRMLLDTWDNLPLERQEKVIGRRKADGAPLSGGTEASKPDLDRIGPDGRAFAIAADAHVRVAAPASNGGAAMLRRGYSYHDGYRDDGAPDAGLLFVAWQADPLKGFVPVQRKLDRGDGLSRFLRHEAGGLFAVPGGAAPGEYVGQRLLES
ncbi:iron uptake transporter deferrochelatase/peroxidase subunit [Actinacidiphila glaucinigra]|uniref:iron uptake transporter deferrochelatase/peroxidase subunit n=1 Tax=Actinacidiphila glaucinigra TaxID=235986 RepID=UPI002DD8A82E|nr:iron uptake transporter deferrochelatase/peroxidase subunit [Actinacidiphila glaucinigra]WSD61076.1 iron uptake transporter deferrochelatase/peroxidase subunit [Actinacidiphila glaucinigra]